MNVSVLFGATSMIALCMAPVNVMSYLLLSMLGRFSSLDDVGRRQRHLVLFAAVSTAIVASLAVFFIGPFIISVIFPEFAEESIRTMRLIILVIPCTVAKVFSRPFIQKFGPIKFLPLLNFINLLAHIVPGILFIPRSGIKGAIISYNIGHVLSAFSSLVVLVWIFRLGSKSTSSSEGPEWDVQE